MLTFARVARMQARADDTLWDRLAFLTSQYATPFPVAKLYRFRAVIAESMRQSCAATRSPTACSYSYSRASLSGSVLIPVTIFRLTGLIQPAIGLGIPGVRFGLPFRVDWELLNANGLEAGLPDDAEA